MSKEVPDYKFDSVEFLRRDLREENDRLKVALRDLVIQFDAYRGGWLGYEWRDRVGLRDDLRRARKLLATSSGEERK